MRPLLLAALLGLAPAAFAQAGPPQPDASQDFRAQRRAQWAQRAAQRRARMAQRLAQRLGLDQQAAAAFQSAFENFASQMKALGPQAKAARKTLRQAAQGDSSAFGQVDAALDQLKSIRSQREKLKQDLFDNLTQGLSPQQKAQLAMMLGRMEHRFARRGFGHRFGHGRFGPGGFGPGGPGGPGGFGGQPPQGGPQGQ